MATSKKNTKLTGLDPRVEYNQEVFDYYDSELAQLRRNSLKYENFFRNKQYSRKEIRDLRDAGLIPLTINVTRPLLSVRRSIITSSRLTWKVVPLQGAMKAVADAGQQLLVGKWNSDYVDIQLNLAIKDCLIAGYGALFVDCASFLDNATFDIIIRHLGWRYLYVDPRSKEFDCSDAENIIVKKNMSGAKAQTVFRLSESELQEAITVETGANPHLQEVEAIDRFSKYPVTKCQVTPKDGYLRDLPSVFYTSALKTKVAQESRDLYDDMKRLEVEGKISLGEMKELNIYRTITVGRKCVYDGLMNIRDYPIIVFQNEQGDTFKDCQGDVEFIEGIQKATNKFYLLTMHNAMLTGNVRFMGPEGAIRNKNQFQRTAAIPGAYLPYTPDPTLPNAGKPEIIQSGSLSGSFYNLTNDLMDKARFETNVYGPMSGDPKQSPETFSTTATLQDFGTQPIKELVRRIDVQIAKCGEVVMQYIQNYTSSSEIIEFIDADAGKMASATYEAQTEAGEQDEAGVDEAGDQIILNERITEEGIVKEIKNNTRLGKFAVRVGTQPNLGTDRLAKGAFLQQMIMNKALPPIPEILGMMFDYLEFPQSAKIVDAIRKYQDAQQNNEQLKSQVDELSKATKVLQDDNLKLQQKLAVENVKGQAAASLERAKGDIEKRVSDIETQAGKTMTSEE